MTEPRTCGLTLEPTSAPGSCRDNRSDGLCFGTRLFLHFCPLKLGHPEASGCFLGGTQGIFVAVSEDCLGGTGKAGDAKQPGAGIIPKPCPMERAGTEKMDETKSHRSVWQGARVARLTDAFNLGYPNALGTSILGGRKSLWMRRA